MEGLQADLGRRLQEIRREIFGQHGAPLMAEALKIPTRTWLNYESGVNMQPEILLAFLELTMTEARWLRTGVGERFRIMRDRYR